MWPILTVSHIESVMSPPLYASYIQWLSDHTGKAGRLAAIISQTAAEFRSALLSNGMPVPSGYPTAVPESCLRHAQTIILFELKRELGLNHTDAENAAAVRSDVFIRGVWSGHIPINRDTAQLSPTYTALASPIADP